MMRTLFYIPEMIGNFPILGWGLLFWLWIAWGVAVAWWQVRRQGWSRDLSGTLLLYAVVAILIGAVLPRLCVEIPGVYSAAGRPLRGLPVRGYGVMLLLGIIAALGLAIHRGKKRGLSTEWVSQMSLWSIVLGMIGARLFHVIEYWPVHYEPIFRTAGLGPGLLAVINIAQGGLVVYGSVIGGIVGLAIFARLQKVRLLAVLDLIVPCFLVGLAFGRIGCFLNGCCFGGVCELPWAVEFPAGSFAYISQVEQGQMAIYGIRFREDANHPQRLPVILEIVPHSAAAEAGVQAGRHILALNDVPLVGPGGESPTSRLAGQLLVLSGDPVILEGGRGCVCAWEPGIKVVSAWSGGQGGEHSAAARQAGASTAVAGPVVHLETSEGDRYVWQLNQSELPRRSLAVHPTQLYSSLNAILLCLFILAYEPFAKRDGELLAWFLTLYPITRFLLEVIRADEPGSYWGLTIGQVTSVALLALGLVTWLMRSWPRKSEPSGEAEALSGGKKP